nr:MAG TPA: hypothetical protein [Caudoviricetes sp.]
MIPVTVRLLGLFERSPSLTMPSIKCDLNN